MSEAAPAPGRLPEAQVHESLRADIARGAMTLAEANASLVGTKYQPLPAPTVAPDAVPLPTAQATPATAPVAPSVPTLAQLRADKGFMLAFLNQEPAAIAKHKLACQIAAGEQVVAPDAMARLEALKADPAFAKRVADGDTTALAEWEQANRAAHQDAPSTDPAAINAAAGLPADDAARDALAVQYQMPKIADDRGEYTPAAQAFDKLTRTALATAGFDRGNGSFLAQEVARTHSHYSKLDDAGKALYAQQQEATLRGIWKADFEPNRKLVLQLAREIDRKHPGTLDILIDSGAANNAMVLNSLWARARAIADAKGVNLEQFK
jgi:hypothetical protein